MKKIFFVLIASALLVATAACSFSFTTANITDAKMTSAVVGGAPADTVTSYPTDTPELIVTGVLNNAPSETTVTFVWYYEGDEVYRTSNDMDEGNGVYVFGTLTNDLGVWPAGNYKAEIYIDEREKPDATVNFTVE